MLQVLLQLTFNQSQYCWAAEDILNWYQHGLCLLVVWPIYNTNIILPFFQVAQESSAICRGNTAQFRQNLGLNSILCCLTYDINIIPSAPKSNAHHCTLSPWVLTVLLQEHACLWCGSDVLRTLQLLHISFSGYDKFYIKPSDKHLDYTSDMSMLWSNPKSPWR